MSAAFWWASLRLPRCRTSVGASSGRVNSGWRWPSSGACFCRSCSARPSWPCYVPSSPILLRSSWCATVKARWVATLSPDGASMLARAVALEARCESTVARVAGAARANARRRTESDVLHIVEGRQRSRCARAARNPKAGRLLSRVLPVVRPRGTGAFRAIASLLLLDGAHWHRLRRRASRWPRNTHARGPLYFRNGLLAFIALGATLATPGDALNQELEGLVHIRFELDARVFAVMAAANAAGFDL